MLTKFSQLDKVKPYSWDIRHILPRVLPAGAIAGKLTAAGASLLDQSGTLDAGSVIAPPEGMLEQEWSVRTASVNARVTSRWEPQHFR